MKVLLLCLLAITILGCSHAAFQCYKCNDCGGSWNTDRARIVLTEGGGNFCTKRVVGNTVTKDYSAVCPSGSGVSCCKDELCNSSNSIYVNFGMLVLVAAAGLLFGRF